MSQRKKGRTKRTARRATGVSTGGAADLHQRARGLLQQGRDQEARALLEAALVRQPDRATAHHDLGALHRRAGDWAAAEACHRQALACDPTLALAHAGLGHVMLGLGRPAEAISHFERALELEPEQAAPALIELGHAYRKAGRREPALRAFDRALEAGVRRVDAYRGRGHVWSDFGVPLASCRDYRQALAVDPKSVWAFNNLAGVLLKLGRVDEALDAYQRAGDLQPDDWLVLSNIVMTTNYHSAMSRDAVYAQHLRVATLPRLPLPALPPAVAEPERQLRIGLVSADLRQHSVSYFLRALFTEHNRETLALIAYAIDDLEDGITTQLRAEVASWCDARGLTPQALAEQVRADRIDVLIDLSGHTGKNRLRVFAARAAPVQVSWLGYPNTTGVPAMDYRLVDAVTDPPVDADNYHSERLIRLPDGFLCYRPPIASERVPVAAPPHARTRAVTFGSFNNLAKTSRATLERWARILSAVPNSRLLLKSAFIVVTNGWDDLIATLAAQGISSERIEVLGRAPTTERHLSLYHRVDIALDTFPYNGTTTTMEALFMGVPVVSECGDRHAARVGASILTRLELPELIARDADDYVRIAVELANDPARLRRYRATIRPRLEASALRDEVGFTRILEKALRQMWRLYCAGDAPQVFEVASARDPALPTPSAAAEQALAAGAEQALVPSTPDVTEQSWAVRVSDRLQVCVPANLDHPLSYALLEQESSIDPELDFLRAWLQPGMRVLDANAAPIGLHALVMAEALRGQGALTAVVSGDARWFWSSLAVHHARALIDVVPAATVAERIDARHAYDLVRLDSECADAVREWLHETLLSEPRQQPLILVGVPEPDYVQPTTLEWLRERGCGIYRLVPGLNLLVPEADEAPPGSVWRFACAPARAAELAASGWLVRREESLSEAPPPARHWAQVLGAYPYVAASAPDGQAIAQWAQLSAGDDPHWPAYEQALNAYLSASETTAPPPARWAWLCQAKARLADVTAAGDTHLATQLLQMRLCIDDGSLQEAAKVAAPLVNAIASGFRVSLTRPYLPALADFDQRDPMGQLGVWFTVVIDEAFERCRARSSAQHQDPRVLRRLLKKPHRHLEMDRRAALLAARVGERPTLPAESPLRQDGQPGHRNAPWWRESFEPAARAQAERRAPTPSTRADGVSDASHWTLTIADEVKVCVPADVRRMTTFILLEQEDWFEAELPFLRTLIEPGMGVLDIGANHGVYALSLAQRLAAVETAQWGETMLATRPGQVLACEPASEPAGMLERSIAENEFGARLSLLRQGLSDHVGEAVLHLGTESELNSLTAGSNAKATTETIELTTLDALAEAPQWPPQWRVDILKLDAEGEEIRILQGGQRFFAEQDPLVLFEWKHGNEPNTGLLEAFAALDYDRYRLVPGLNALVPVAEDEALDGYQLNLFACKPSRAERLAAAGRLLEAASAAMPATAPPPAHTWPQALAALPFVPALRADGQALLALQALDRSADPHWPAYEQALNAYLSASDSSQPLPSRWVWLQQSRALLDQLHSVGDSHLASVLLRIRVLDASGARTEAVQANAELVKVLDTNLQARFDRPFLPPLADFDQRPLRGGIGAWVQAAICEGLELRRAHSAYFRRDGSLLQALANNPNRSLAMNRRRALLALLAGHQVQLAPNSPLGGPEATPGHRNVEWWQRLPQPDAGPAIAPAATTVTVPAGLLALWLDWLREHPFRILDIGAASHGRHTEPYASLMQAGCAQVLGFEPDARACEELNRLYGTDRRYRYLPQFVGQGGPATFYETSWSMTGSLLKPNTPVLERFEQLGEVVALKATHPIATVRLADLPDAAEIDLLKIDVQGAELEVFEGAGTYLDNALVIWTEVEFIPLYEHQPLFRDVDRFLSERGFLLHSFDGIAARRFKPFVAAGGQHPRRSQAIWADAIYVRDFRRLDTLTTLKLKKLAVLLDQVVGAQDLCFEVLGLLDAREGTALAQGYVGSA